MYYPKLVGFGHFLKSGRSRSTDSVEPTAVIYLLFPIYAHIFQKYNLLWDNSAALVVHIELRGQEAHYRQFKMTQVLKCFNKIKMVFI